MLSNKEIALSYLERGLSVIPLYSPEMVNRNPPGKFIESLQKQIAENEKKGGPLTKEDIFRKLLIYQCKLPIVSWKEYQTRLPTKEEVNHWFTMNPDANIAIVTGKVSNLVVFDLDSDHAVEYADSEGGFPDTVKVKTGKGYHIYMKHPGFEVRNKVNKKLDIDIRADGGYVAAPPSIHGSGHKYDWEEGVSISEIDPADCTPWMIDYLTAVAKDNTPATPEKKGAFKNKSKEYVKKADKKDEYVDILKNGCSEGNRNHTATKLIGYLLKTNMPVAELWEMLKMWNQKNTPPMDEAELRKTFNSVKDLESKSQEKEIKIDSFLDTPQTIVSEYDQNYIRVPFAGDGLSFLEKQMNGGLIGGRFYILGGIPSSGKTALINNIADNICLNDHPVLFFSYDDGKSELNYRTLSRFSKHSIEDFNKNTLQKKDVNAVCKNQNIKKILSLKYVVQAMIKVEKWSNLIEQIQKKHNKPPVIIIDYLRKLRTENKSSDERLRVDNILSNLTELAKKYNSPVVAISELARDSYRSGQRLSMASFKESGTIEYEASWLGILAAVEENSDGYNLKKNWEKIIEQDGIIDLIVFKSKRGTGATGKIPLQIDKDKMTVAGRKDKPGFDTTTKFKGKSSMFD